MIKLTRLNGKEFVMNAEIIRTVESKPDTTITVVQGEKFIVQESVQEVVKRAVAYGRAVRTFKA